MAVTVPATTTLYDGVMEMTKSAQSKNADPLMWAVELSSSLLSAGVSMPSTTVAELLVEHICWANNVPIAWKFLEKALSIRVVPPMFVLALLSNRVIPSRRRHPAAYRLFLELLKRHIFPLASEINGPNYHKIMESIDDTLHLNKIFGFESSEPGLVLVEFIFSVVWELLYASLDDENLLELVPEKTSPWPIKSVDMDIDDHNNYGEHKIDYHQGLYKMNTITAIEIIGEIFRDKVTSRILQLARRNMPAHWGSFMHHLRLLVGNSTALRNSKDITPEALLQLTSDNRVLMSKECKASSLQQFHAVMASGSLISSAGPGQSYGASRLLPLDLFLEDTMDGYVVATTSAAETLTDLLKAHQAITQASWQDTFLGLWIAALRLVQREGEAAEGPVPRLDTCLCLLLCTTTLAVGNIIDEENALLEEKDHKHMHHGNETQVLGNCRKSLVASLQQLGDFEGLLTPPPLVISIANQAAAKAILVASGISVGSGFLDGVTLNDMPNTCAGNMRHLIVEACIARNLLDTSTYLWPGYVKGHSNQIPRTISGQTPGWSTLMKGSPLTSQMMHVLVSTPASSLAEVEKIYGIAINGSEEEKIFAATVLCGASLTRGWNIQEHTGFFIIKLLSPPTPVDYSGNESHLIVYAPLLNVLLMGISSIDCVQIFSLHGLAPHLAGVLMPICEVFGSCSPTTVSWTLPNGDRMSPLSVFSNAFILLLKLWRFHQPPLENMMGDVTPVGSQLNPEFLLLARNNPLNNQKTRRGHFSNLSSSEPIFLDSFPKLTFWHRQHQVCMASTLSDLKPGTSVYQIFDALLSMMFRNVNKVGQSLSHSASGSSGSCGPIPEDCANRLNLPAWEILEAVPFVLDAALTACAHGKLSPPELITGLRELAIFLPASMATIVSYLSAETTRGLWKPASMNGTDWPSPAANLAMVENNINKILSATGVDVPSLSAGGTTPTLPLPLAALVSLTITYKVDRVSESVLNLAAPALNTLGASCPWPCMAIISSLWAQKAKRWTDYLVFSASRTVFHHNNNAVVQLLRMCFKSVITQPPSFSGGCVGGLLGHGFGSNSSGGMSPVAPGILYLRVHRSVGDVMFMTEEIVSLLMHTVKDIVSTDVPVEKLKKSNGLVMRYGEVSLSAAMGRIKLAASLGASLVWITGRLNLIQSLIKETLPSWFISGHKSDQSKGDSGGMIGMLMGYALAYFAVLSGAFGWGVEPVSLCCKKRPVILGAHLEFMASALDGKISLGCNRATWRAYVSGFVSLMVTCAPKWATEVDVTVLKRLSKGLRKWDEEELALTLLEISGVSAMGSAAEMIIESSGYSVLI
ncbi:mediator of RNA polymerase II transcription subunit 33A-like [Bidens hawaiensis]|uniref:mediator of RNA polymerase II transcription subunit 33A-like n=1 Tax=Bidens hawaiensis TaxID=980011 RepID=UPI004049A328